MPCKIWCARVAYPACQSMDEIVELIEGKSPFIRVDVDPDLVDGPWNRDAGAHSVILGVRYISSIEPLR